MNPNEGEISAWHYGTRQPITLRWREGVVTHIETAATAPPRDVWIAPGLFDVQINGYGGVDFQQDNVGADDLLSAARKLRADGCTRFLLTLITDDWPALTARLRRFRALRSQCAELQSAIVGWHIEGPFLSSEPGFHGAHDPAKMLDPTPEHILELRTITGDDALLLTMSPERSGVLKAIQLAASRGARISLGHTNASTEILQNAVLVGATGFTHLGNGCPREMDRHDNIFWRVFDTPRLTVSLIPDKIHVSPQCFRAAHRILGDNILYTTDAMAAAGAPPGRYTIGKVETEVGADQIVRQPGRTNFAGSALRPADGVFRAAEMLKCPWQETWARFSETPAKFMGLRNAIAVGEPANFCVLKIAGQNQFVDLQVCAPDTSSGRGD
jgi:N-acetylglucosamine-6-phosphate deacetylase